MYSWEKLEVDPRLIVARIYLLSKVKRSLSANIVDLWVCRIVANNTYTKRTILLRNLKFCWMQIWI